MDRYIWSKLNKQQVGAYTEYFVKMEMTMFGYQVYTTEIDDRGIDFVARHGSGPFIEIQVKSLRANGYVFLRKSHFQLSNTLYLALGFLREGAAPELYLIPSSAWQEPNALFVSRDYEGQMSEPEWGLNLSLRNLGLLQPYSFGKVIQSLVAACG